MAEFYEIEAITGNMKCFRVLEEIYDRVMNGDDLYSVVASYLFDVDYSACTERDELNNPSAEGKARRSFAKQLLLANKQVADIIYDITDLRKELKCTASDLKEMIVNKFPWTPKEDVYNLNITFDERVVNSYTFISLIRGYVMIHKYNDSLNEFSNSKEIYSIDY